MAFKVQVGPAQIAIHQGQTVLVTEPDGQVNWPSDRGLYFRYAEPARAPTEVEDRLVPGHWEGDLIKGARNQSAVGTLVERTSRLVLLARMEGATAEAALAGFTCILTRVHMPMRKTPTYDQGKEMSRHQDVTALTGVTVYFADPHSPWQRGSNENTNGLLRHYLPKGTARGTERIGHDAAGNPSTL
jgi:IS30 family transposase